MTNENYVTVKQAAEIAGVHLQTVYTWIAEGKLQAEKHPVTKRVRINKALLMDLIQGWERK